MSDMGTEGRTIIFVSHNMAAIEQLTQKCVVISQGETVFEGPSEEAVDHYLDRQKSDTSRSSDVSSLPRVSWAGDQSIKIVHAEIPNLENGKLKCGDSLRLRLGVTGQRHLRSFSFGITLNYRDGTPVGSAFGVECGPIGANECQMYDVELEVSGLSSGHYWMTVGVMRGNREVIDVIHEVLHFNMDSPDLLPAGVMDWNPGWGRFRLESTCRAI
jgi:lipopolysaccharide transport system ATP-binding protein